MKSESQNGNRFISLLVRFWPATIFATGLICQAALISHRLGQTEAAVKKADEKITASSESVKKEMNEFRMENANTHFQIMREAGELKTRVEMHITETQRPRS